MRTLVTIVSLIAASATCTALAQDRSAQPTDVRQTSVYICPSHPEIQATWPARCPMCQRMLSRIQLSLPADAGATLAADKDEKRETEEAREARQNEERRERQRNEEAREARRNEELRERYPNYGYAYPYPNQGYTYVYPPQGYSYQYPYYGYYPNYGYVSPYPYNGYYYNPNTGYYYNPNTGAYYYPSNQYGQYGYQAPYPYPPNPQYGGILNEMNKLFGRNQ